MGNYSIHILSSCSTLKGRKGREKMLPSLRECYSLADGASIVRIMDVSGGWWWSTVADGEERNSGEDGSWASLWGMFFTKMSYGCSVGCYLGSILLEYGMKDVFQAGFVVGFLSFFLFYFFFLSFPFLSVFLPLFFTWMSSLFLGVKEMFGVPSRIQS